jgi:hypothetical protein
MFGMSRRLLAAGVGAGLGIAAMGLASGTTTALAAPIDCNLTSQSPWGIYDSGTGTWSFFGTASAECNADTSMTLALELYVSPDGVNLSYVTENDSSCVCSSISTRVPGYGSVGNYPPATFAHVRAYLSFDDGAGDVVTKIYPFSCSQFDAMPGQMPVGAPTRTISTHGGQRSLQAQAETLEALMNYNRNQR